jgi:hydroxymethylpyrimidine pyrophosphatase-like HAD family hydrolase
MIGKGHLFITNNVLNYTNVGSLEEWLAYNNHPVIFCDIDGTLVEAQSRHGKNTYADKPIALQQNVDRIKALQNSGCQIVFTTARPKEVLDVTVKMLEEIGFENPFVIIGLYNSTRILINDYNDSNPYPRAIAINIERNNDNLKDFL